ncbi:MAG: PIN domain-containing protein [Thiotrichaceae bacterium]|nr:PIN domain-containing protein [Thiotrichaceae bacterium]
MSDNVLFDTCAWIDFLRYPEGILGDMIAEAIEMDKALLCGVVKAELLQGAKGKKENQQLNLLFSSIESLPCDEALWNEAGLLLQDLRRKGITLPLTDALIAVVARKHRVDIVTLDKHFQHLPVNVINPSV